MTKQSNRSEQIGIMKAKPVTDKLVSRLGSFCLVQPKLRGQRAHVVWPDENNPLLISSYGIPFRFLPHITEALRTLPRLRYDGELYVHSPKFTQEHLNSILNRTKNPHPDSHLIEYHIFDLIEDSVQWKRLMNRDCALFLAQPPIRLVPYYSIPTAEWQSYAQRFISLGYEGIILRDSNGTYSPLDPTNQAKRPSCLLKFKPTETDEYEIIAYREGVEQYVGALGSLLVSPDGTEAGAFWVGTGAEFTKEKRFAYWLERDSLIGQTLIVKHEPIRTVSGLPICTVGYKIVNRKPRKD